LDKTALAGHIEQVCDQSAAYTLTPMCLFDRHTHNTACTCVFSLQRCRANRLTIDFCNDEYVTEFRVMRGDVIQVWIARLVDPPEMLAQAGKD